jgi:MFS family permease
MEMPISNPGSRRTQLSIYALAFFTGNLFPMISVIMPLWVLQLSASPFVIGLIISSRQILAVLFSIHGGTLLDRFDPRRVILVIGLAGAATTMLYPVLPFVWAAILLQMLSGFTETTNWIGAQALVGRLLHGGAVYAGRMTAAARIGGFAGPILAGLAWQAAGPYGAFGFIALWILCGVVTTMFLPAADLPEPVNPPTQSAGKESGIRNLLPNPADYMTTLKLLVLPAVVLVIAATFMRQAGSGIQSSFYAVWLNQAGFSAGVIGLLIGVGNLVSAGAALSIGPLTRRFNEHWLLLAVIFLAIAAIAITPMLHAVAILLVAISFRGVGQGLNLPLMLSIAARAVGRDFQGRVAALRIAFNRLGSMLVPFAMGAIAEVAGLESAFYIVGLSGAALTGLLAIWISRQPALR